MLYTHIYTRPPRILVELDTSNNNNIKKYQIIIG